MFTINNTIDGICRQRIDLVGVGIAFRNGVGKNHESIKFAKRI